MKFRNKAIISAVVSASLMLAGAVGGTIAFFTTSSETNVNVTSGKIAVSTVVSDLKTYSLEQEQPAGTFENGGTAALNAETQVITLDRMTPGDKATFKIAVSIENNVKVKYRVVFDKTGDLAPALVANVSGGASEWTMINPTENPIAVNLDGSVELPLSTSINYADKAGSVKILVEAVQGNMPTTVSDANQLQSAIANIPAAGGEVDLYIDKDITLTQRLAIPSNAQVNLYGDGTKTITNASNEDRVINFDSVENSTLTLSGVNIHQGSKAYSRCISAYNTKNCTINVFDSNLKNDSHYPINIAGKNTGTTVNIEDSKIEGYCAINVYSPSVINVKNSSLTGINPNSGASNGFTVICFDKDQSNGASSAGSIINLENCTVSAINTGDQFESFFFVKTSDCQINSTNTIYKIQRSSTSPVETYNSIEEIADYNSLFWTYNSTTPSLNVEWKEIAYQEGEEAREYSFILLYSIDEIYTPEEITDFSTFIYGEIGELRQTKLGANSLATSNCRINGKQILMPCNLITE